MEAAGAEIDFAEEPEHVAASASRVRLRRARRTVQQSQARAPADPHAAKAAMLSKVMAVVQSILGFAPSHDQVPAHFPNLVFPYMTQPL
jgi:hypothetical protein